MTGRHGNDRKLTAETSKPTSDPSPRANGRPSGPWKPYRKELADTMVRGTSLFVDERFWQALGAVLSFFLSSIRVSLLSAPRSRSAEEKKVLSAKLFRQLLIDLGPTYIKLGQFLSVRRDLLPVEFADELASLQDRVPPFGAELVQKTIMDELGASPEELFISFDPVPIASASIGQVHKVILKDGQKAVLKVQRPGLARAFYRDLGLLRTAARTGLYWGRKIRELKAKLGIEASKKPGRFDFQNWLDLSDEFGKTLFEEIDYLLEGRNADRLRRLLRERTDILVPRVFWKYSGRRVLSLEFVDALKIDRLEELKAKGHDPEEIGNLLIGCYLEQIVMKGFFHADPHAGNLAVDDYGRLVIYDYGMMGELSEEQRKSLLNCVLGTINRDPEILTKSLVELGIVRPNSSLDAVGRAIAPFMDYYAGKSLFDLDFRELERDIDIVVNERSLRLPANLAYLLRAGSSLEGIARTLKPDFSFSQAVKPTVKKWLTSQGLESFSSLASLMQLANAALSRVNRKKTGELERDSNGRLESGTPSSSAISPKPNPPCQKCRKKIRQMETSRRRLIMLLFFFLAYALLTLGTMALIVHRGLLMAGAFGFYFLVANIIVGGIITLKFVQLIEFVRLSKFGDSEKLNIEKSRLDDKTLG